MQRDGDGKYGLAAKSMSRVYELKSVRHLHQRWGEGCQSVRVLMAENQTLGYVGCYGGLGGALQGGDASLAGR
jgi:hypothetical protein